MALYAKNNTYLHQKSNYCYHV